MTDYTCNHTLPPCRDHTAPIEISTFVPRDWDEIREEPESRGGWIVTVIDRLPEPGERGWFVDGYADPEHWIDQVIDDSEPGEWGTEHEWLPAICFEWERIRGTRVDKDGDRLVTVLIEESPEEHADAEDTPAEARRYLVARFDITGWATRDVRNLRGKLIEAGYSGNYPNSEPEVRVETGDHDTIEEHRGHRGACGTVTCRAASE